MEPELKRCTKCGEMKDVGEFHKDSRHVSGLNVRCKICSNEYRGNWRKKHRTQENEYSRKWVLNNPKKHMASVKRWQLANPEKRDAASKRWRVKHPKQLKISQMKNDRRKASTPNGMLNNRMHAAIWSSLKERKSGRRWESLVGFTASELYAHIESLFTDGMSWENMGKWHLDHIVPKSRFHYEHPEDQEFRVCWGLANLQPMWAKDNLSKHTKTMEEWEIAKNGKQ